MASNNNTALAQFLRSKGLTLYEGLSELEIVDVNSILGVIQADLNGVKTLVIKAGEDIVFLQNQLTSLGQTVTNNNAQLTADLELLRQRINTLESNVTLIHNQLTGLATVVTDLNTQFTTELNAINLILESNLQRILNVEQSIDEISSQVETIFTELQSFNSDMLSLSARVSALEAMPRPDDGLLRVGDRFTIWIWDFWNEHPSNVHLVSGQIFTIESIQNGHPYTGTNLRVVCHSPSFAENVSLTFMYLDPKNHKIFGGNQASPILDGSTIGVYYAYASSPSTVRSMYALTITKIINRNP